MKKNQSLTSQFLSSAVSLSLALQSMAAPMAAYAQKVGPSAKGGMSAISAGAGISGAEAASQPLGFSQSVEFNTVRPIDLGVGQQVGVRHRLVDPQTSARETRGDNSVSEAELLERAAQAGQAAADSSRQAAPAEASSLWERWTTFFDQLGKKKPEDTGGVVAGKSGLSAQNVSQTPQTPAPPAPPAPPNRPTAEGGEFHHEKGVWSYSRLNAFIRDPERFARVYEYGLSDSEKKGLELVVGTIAHETMQEVLERQIKDPSRKKSLKEAVAIYNEKWEKAIKEGYVPNGKFTLEDYRRRGGNYVVRVYRQYILSGVLEKMGEIFMVEGRTAEQIKSGKDSSGGDYREKRKRNALRLTLEDGGIKHAIDTIPDLVLVGKDGVYVMDWKTHRNPPTLADLEQDHQLDISGLALQENFPALKGKKMKTVWLYKEFMQTRDARLPEAREWVLNTIHAAETFLGRIRSEKEKPQWDRRMDPKAEPAQTAKAQEDADKLGDLQLKIQLKEGEVAAAKAEKENLEQGLSRFARKRADLDEITGKKHSVKLVREKGKELPRKAENPEAYQAVEEILRKSGRWDDYSELERTRSKLKDVVEVQGHPDHGVFSKLIGTILKPFHKNEIKVGEISESPAPVSGNVPGFERKEESPDKEHEPGVYSATKIQVFERSLREYALKYIFKVKDAAPQSYELLIGLSAHETMYEVFDLIQGGRRPSAIKLADVLKRYEEIWKELEREGNYKPIDARTGRPTKISRKQYLEFGKEYIEAKWKQYYPFRSQGQVIFLERRMFFRLTDPKTGKAYLFQIIPDRVMSQGNRRDIRDWKTHLVPVPAKELRQKDIQMLLYNLGLEQLYPHFMKDAEVRRIWDFKEEKDVVVLDTTPQDLKRIKSRILNIIPKIEKFTAQVKSHPEKWEKAGQKTPKTLAEAKKWVDRLGQLKEEIKAKEEALEALEAKGRELENSLSDFHLQTGVWFVQGKEYSSRLIKKSEVRVPNKEEKIVTDGKEKTVESPAYKEMIAALKNGGVWGRVSQLSLKLVEDALEAAKSDPRHPDRKLLSKVSKYLSKVDEIKIKLRKQEKK